MTPAADEEPRIILLLWSVHGLTGDQYGEALELITPSAVVDRPALLLFVDVDVLDQWSRHGSDYNGPWCWWSGLVVTCQVTRHRTFNFQH
jgi:hypothetical protein